MSDYPIGGHCDERFAPVRAAFIKNYDDDMELGSSFALMIGDDTLIDLWGGFADKDRSKPWEETPLFLSPLPEKLLSICVPSGPSTMGL